METTRSLYVMLSRTGTSMGKMIRLFTRYSYNHVSLSLDSQLCSWVSFARRVCNVPLAGGLVRETARRFHAMNGPVWVRIYRIDIPRSKFAQLEELFCLTGSKELIYNTYSAMLTPFGIRWRIPGAYTCLEFAEQVLEQRFASIRALDLALTPKLVFEGDLKLLIPISQEAADSYFDRRSALGGFRDTVWHFCRLTGKAVRPWRTDPVKQHLSRKGC